MTSQNAARRELIDRDRRPHDEADPGLNAMDGARIVSPSRPLVSPAFRPAAAYLLESPPASPDRLMLVRVDDTDVGPLFVDPADTVIGRSLRAAKTWEPGEGRFLRSALRPGMHVVDAGANIGYFTRLMARAVGPTGRVLAIEADPGMFRILRANVALESGAAVELLPVAAHRQCSLVYGSRDLVNHGASTAFSLGDGYPATPMQAVRIDDVLDPDVAVDFIKIDVEGMDGAVVQGLERTIRCWQPSLLVELNPWKSEAFGDVPADVLRMYREFGLEIRLLGGDCLRLHREAGMALDDILLDNLVVTVDVEDEIIARTRSIHFVNLILSPDRQRLAAFRLP